MEPMYELIYRGERYQFVKEHYRYVIGLRDDISPPLSDRWTYFIKLARQQHAEKHRAQHREAHGGKFTVIK